MKEEIRKTVEAEIEAEQISTLLADKLQADGEQGIRENEGNAKDPRFQLTAGANRRLHRRIQKELSSCSPHARHLRGMLPVAALLLLIAVGATVYANREKIINYIVEQHELYLFSGDGDHDYVDEILLPGFIPDGYSQLITPVISHGILCLTYQEDGGDGYILFGQSSYGVSRFVDTEDAESVMDIQIGDSAGRLVIGQDGKKKLLWGMHGECFLISSSVSTDDLRQMAESVALPVKP